MSCPTSSWRSCPFFWYSLGVLQLGLKWRSTQAVIVALFVGTVFLYVTNWKRIREKNKFDPITKGMMNAMASLANTAIIVGFAGVVTNTAAHDAMVEKLLSINANPYVTVVIAVAAICALCAERAACLLSRPRWHKTFLGMGVNPAALHRLTLATATTFDSMPHNGALNVTMQVMGLTHKEVYKHICVVGRPCHLHAGRAGHGDLPLLSFPLPLYLFQLFGKAFPARERLLPLNRLLAFGSDL